MFLPLLALIASPATPGQTQTQAAAPPLFTFRSGFWTNLHHFAYVLGRARNGAPDSHRSAVANAVPEEAEVDTLSAAERSAWDGLIRFYQGSWSRRDPIRDRDLSALALDLARTPDGSAPGPAVDPGLAEALRAAAPVYRRVWWPRHAAENRARIADLVQLLRAYGPAVAAVITEAYQVTWPAAGFPVEVSAYANWAGAYSTADGLIVLSGGDAAMSGDQGLECVFHEAMHQWDDTMIRRINRAAGERNGAAPGSLSHSLIFYTAGYAVSSVLPQRRTYAETNGLWSRGGLVPKEILDAAWRPYLRGMGDLDQALKAVLAALAAAPVSVPR